MNRRCYACWLHPFLFGIFPALSLLSHNILVVSLSDILKPVLLTLIATAILLAALKTFSVKAEKAGIMVSALWLLFFSFGQLLGLIFGTTFGEIPRGALVAWTLIWLVVLVGLWIIVLRTGRNLEAFNKILTAMAVAAVALPVLFSIIRVASGGSFVREWTPQNTALLEQVPATSVSRPDIYYIIVDGYGREDTLERIYGLDNGLFLDELRSRGFSIIEQARSNYSQTTFSLSSSLNMEYIQKLIVPGKVSEMDLIQDNSVMAILDRMGYRMVAFSSGYTETEIKHVDTVLGPGFALSEYQNLLLNYTPIPVMMDLLNTRTQYDLHRDRLIYTLDHLPDPVGGEGPLFVFAHLLIPHPPFVFDEEGNPVNPKTEFSLKDGLHYFSDHTRPEYIRCYGEQLRFLNGKLLKAVDTILKESREPPVLIIQGDHGPGSALDWSSAENSDLEERMSILNALHLPDNGETDLYAGMTPVNTFRIICNRYFHSELPILKDSCYFSRWESGYNFTDVTDRLEPRLREEVRESGSEQAGTVK